MQDPTQKQLEEIRKEGYKPGVVSCFVNNGNLLMMFKREYNLWMLPQGGIANQENAEQALDRQIQEELGKEFFEQKRVQNFRIELAIR